MARRIFWYFPLSPTNWTAFWIWVMELNSILKISNQLSYNNKNWREYLSKVFVFIISKLACCFCEIGDYKSFIFKIANLCQADCLCQLYFLWDFKNFFGYKIQKITWFIRCKLYLCLLKTIEFNKTDCFNRLIIINYLRLRWIDSFFNFKDFSTSKKIERVVK